MNNDLVNLKTTNVNKEVPVDKSKEKSKKSAKKSKKSDNGLKRPTTPYFLFCQEQRDELKKKGEEKK